MDPEIFKEEIFCQMTLGLCPPALFAGILMMTYGDSVVSAILFVFVFLSLICYFLFKKLGKLNVILLLYLLQMFVVIAIGSAYSGGMLGPFIYGFIIFPVICTFFLSSKNATIMCIISLGVIQLIRFEILKIENIFNINYFKIHLLFFELMVFAVFILACIFKNVNKRYGELALISARKAEDHLVSLKETQNHLVQAAKLTSLGTMAAGMCHELNNPLVGVKGFAQIMMRNQSLDENARRHVELILKASAKMEKIINHLRLFSRETKEDDWGPIDLAKPIEGSIILLGQQLREANITVKIDYEEKAIIYGENNLLESIFQNFLTNSRDAFEDIKDDRSKLIMIKIQSDHDKKVILVYTDNATGIPDEVIDHMYEPFFTTKEAGRGTGLGMSIAHGIVKQHQAEIMVESKENEGTKFTIIFPPYSDKAVEQTTKSA